ncbi:hypothetical protein ACWEQ7_03945 [Streptomyces sp. NPDC004069]
MTREERRALLGDDVIAHIHARVAKAPEPTDELVEELRRIMTHPAGEIPALRPTEDVRPAARAA